MLSRDIYRETKNFIRINLVEDGYSRLPFASSRHYKRVDFTKDETVIGIPTYETWTITSNNNTEIK